MMEARAGTASVVHKTRSVQAGATVVGVHFLGATANFVLGEESLLSVPRGGEPRPIAIHAGAILSSAADERRIVTGADDGKVMATGADGAGAVIATDPRQRWIDHVAIGPGGALAWSAGKQVFAHSAGGNERMLEAPSTVGGLAFAPKGMRLAVAHYNGVTLWFPNAQTEAQLLAWKGSHLGVMLSPDGRFLVTSMQEPTLHGWRIVDGRHMRMAGYAAKVRALSWSAGGKWLASSGSDQLVLWPFAGKDGPMGKEPRLLAPTDRRVVAVACHPVQDVVAVGYENGLVLLVRIDDGAEIPVNKPGGAAASALAWNATGAMLAFGCEDGQAGILRL